MSLYSPRDEILSCAEYDKGDECVECADVLDVLAKTHGLYLVPWLLYCAPMSLMSMRKPKVSIWSHRRDTDTDTYNPTETFGLLPSQKYLYNVGPPSPHY